MTQRDRERIMWQILMLVGVGLALVGSYMGVSAAFDDDTLCLGPGFRCVTVEDTDEIWFGLIMTVVGVAAVFKARRQLR